MYTDLVKISSLMYLRDTGHSAFWLEATHSKVSFSQLMLTADFAVRSVSDGRHVLTAWQTLGFRI